MHFVKNVDVSFQKGRHKTNYSRHKLKTRRHKVPFCPWNATVKEVISHFPLIFLFISSSSSLFGGIYDRYFRPDENANYSKHSRNLFEITPPKLAQIFRNFAQN